MTRLDKTRPRPPIRALLRVRDIEVTTLAQELGYSPGVLSLIVRGHTQPWPKIKAVLAAHLNVSESELFGDA